MVRLFYPLLLTQKILTIWEAVILPVGQAVAAPLLRLWERRLHSPPHPLHGTIPPDHLKIMLQQTDFQAMPMLPRRMHPRIEA